MTLVLTEDEVRSVLDVRSCVKAVEEAFRAYGEGRVNMPPKAYLDLEKGDFRAMYGELKGSFQVADICGMKWVNVHPENPKKGIPTVMAVIILNDPETGLPLAVMDGSYITDMRTGAAAAVATKYLSKEDSG
ncbi:MAG: ornithine cyclodeaminase family protein, partial [Candidatus Altiarchaeota archaeon]